MPAFVNNCVCVFFFSGGVISQDKSTVTLWQTNMAMENGPFEDVFPIEHRDIPLL